MFTRHNDKLVNHSILHVKHPRHIVPLRRSKKSIVTCHRSRRRQCCVGRREFRPASRAWSIASALLNLRATAFGRPQLHHGSGLEAKRLPRSAAATDPHSLVVVACFRSPSYSDHPHRAQPRRPGQEGRMSQTLAVVEHGCLRWRPVLRSRQQITTAKQLVWKTKIQLPLARKKTKPLLFYWKILRIVSISN